MNIVGLVVGATGIAGRGACQELLARGAEVYGLSRRAEGLVPCVRYVAADLLDPEKLKMSLGGLKPTHVYIATWSRQATEAENIEVNSRMVRNLLAALAAARSVKHVALVTGLKHYLGPFEAYVKAGTPPPTPLREEQRRL